MRKHRWPLEGGGWRNHWGMLCWPRVHIRLQTHRRVCRWIHSCCCYLLTITKDLKRTDPFQWFYGVIVKTSGAFTVENCSANSDPYDMKALNMKTFLNFQAQLYIRVFMNSLGRELDPSTSEIVISLLVLWNHTQKTIFLYWDQFVVCALKPKLPVLIVVTLKGWLNLCFQEFPLYKSNNR